MGRLEIRLFGRLELRHDGEPWPLGAPPRAAGLLAYLLVRAGQPVARAVLATQTWPDDAEDEARGKLRRHLHRIAHALPEQPAGAVPWLDVSASSVRWNPASASWIDVAAFDAAAADPQRLAEAIELYRGDFLEGQYDDWALLERERYQARFLELCYDAALRARRERDFDAAVRYADRMLATDEWREDAVRLAMAARYEAGDRTEALASFERFGARLRAEMRVEPMPETLSLRAAILANAPIPGQLDGGGYDAAASPAAPFVGRAQECRTLEAAWLRAARGRGTSVFVGGEAGIGKSRLVAEIGSHVAAQGGRALFGRTSNPEAFPYEAIVDALRGSLPLIAQSNADPIWLSSLAQLLPELREQNPGLADAPALDPPRARARLFEAIARVVEALARSRPLLLVVEDAHWANAATLDALEALARRIGALPVLLLITYRAEDGGPDRALGALRRGLQSERRAGAMTLHGLGRDDVERLVALQPRLNETPPELFASVWGLSEGNPFFVNQLVGSYVETGTIPDAGAAARSVGQTILERVSLLPRRERTLAQVAASIGRTFSVDALSRVLAWPEADAIDALGTLLDRGLVRESGDAAFSYAFGHALIAATVYDSTPERRRVALHRRIARALTDMGPSHRRDLAAVGRHWRLAGDARRAGAAYAKAAGAAFAAGARDETIEYAREAVALTGDAHARFGALLMLCRAQAGYTNHERWRTDLEALSQLAAGLGDDERYATLEQWESYCAQTADRAAQRETVEAMLASPGQAAQARRAGALCALGVLELLVGDLRQARAMLREALRVAFLRGDRETAANARQRLVGVQIRLGLLDEAEHHISAMRTEAQTHPSVENRSYLCYAQAQLAIAQEDHAMCERAGEALLRLAEETGDLDGAARGHGLAALGAYHDLRLAEGREHYRKAVELCERLGHAQLLVSNLCNWGSELRMVGQLAEAARVLERAREVARQTGSRDKIGYCAGFLGQLALDLGEPERAAEHARVAREQADASGELRLRILADLVSGAAACALGEVDAGVASMAGAVALRRSAYEARVALVEDLCSYARALLDAGRNEAARDVCTELREEYERDPSRLERPARICWIVAREAEANGRAAEARTWLARGRDIVAREIAGMAGDDRDAFLSIPFNRALVEGPAARPAAAAPASRPKTRTALRNS